ncbi:putative UPF0481 protein [Tanacetum coccineum]
MKVAEMIPGAIPLIRIVESISQLFAEKVVLRNLVAYEKLMAVNDTTFAFEYGLDLIGHVDFMSGIIDTVKDVKILRVRKVIENDLDDEEIVKLFNRMRKTRRKVSVKMEMMKIVAQLNKVYDITPIVWFQNLIEKQLRAWSKIITVTISILTTLFLFHQGGVKLYGSNPPDMILIRNL